MNEPETVTCMCGESISSFSFARHLQSAKHKDRMLAVNEDNQPINKIIREIIKLDLSFIAIYDKDINELDFKVKFD